jgi:hypothetical protein
VEDKCCQTQAAPPLVSASLMLDVPSCTLPQQDRAAALNERQALRVTSSTARHEQLLHALSTANVVSADKLENPFGHVAYRVVLEEPDTRRRWGGRARCKRDSMAHLLGIGKAAALMFLGVSNLGQLLPLPMVA